MLQKYLRIDLKSISRYLFTPLLISLFTLIIMRPLLWSQTSPPDSQFYTGYIFHGNALHEKLGTLMPNAPYDNYFWTRIGYIVPSRIALLLFGDNTGYILLRLLLIAVMSTVIALAYRELSGISVLFLQVLLATNSVILSLLSGDYSANFGSVFVITSIVAVHGMYRNGSCWQKRTGFLVGILICFSFWSYPSHLIISGFVFAIYLSWPNPGFGIKKRLAVAIAAAAGFVITTILLLLLGNMIFPGAKFIQATLHSLVTIPRIMKQLSVDQNWVIENPITKEMTIWFLFLGIISSFLIAIILKWRPQRELNSYLVTSASILFAYFFVSAYINFNQTLRGWFWIAPLYLISLLLVGDQFSRYVVHLSPIQIVSIFFVGIALLFLLRDIAQISTSGPIVLLIGLVITSSTIWLGRTFDLHHDEAWSSTNRTKAVLMILALAILVIPNIVQNSEKGTMYGNYNYPQSNNFGSVFQSEFDLSSIDDIAKAYSTDLINKLPDGEYFAVSNPNRNAINDYTTEMLLWPANSFDYLDKGSINRFISLGIYNFVVVYEYENVKKDFLNTISEFNDVVIDCSVMEAKGDALSYCIVQLSP